MTDAKTYVIIKKKDGGFVMQTISITQARTNLYQTVANVNEYSQPVMITNNKGKNAVLISEDDWRAIQETIYLNSIPGLAESILEGKSEPLSECTTYDPDEEW